MLLVVASFQGSQCKVMYSLGYLKEPWTFPLAVRSQSTSPKTGVTLHICTKYVTYLISCFFISEKEKRNMHMSYMLVVRVDIVIFKR